MADPRILAVIPARGGSKGVHRKNVREVCGKPMIVYTIETALAAKHLFCDIVVSTDDQEIAQISREAGATVPFIRPPELSHDKVPMIPVLQHSAHFIEQRDNQRLDWICLLQPTEPFRTVQDIEEAIKLGVQGNGDSVISVVQVFSVHPMLMKKIEEGYLQPFCIEEKEGTRRQDYSPPAYMRNGAIYLTRRDVLLEENSIWGHKIIPYIMPPERSVGVDDENDMAMVEVLMRKKLGIDK